MKILFTFEFPALIIRAEDYINLLLYFGHEVDLYAVGDNSNLYLNYMSQKIQKENFKVLFEPPDYDNYQAWYYDLSTQTRWQYTTYFENALINFKGTFLACINFEDGYHFFIDRVTDYIKSRTCIWMNNALYRDREKYNMYTKLPGNNSLEKLFLTTSYITNSQLFKNNLVDYKNKLDRVIFSGALTGHSTKRTNYDLNEMYARFTLSKLVHDDKNINSIVRFTGYEPTFKKIYDDIVTDLFKQTSVDQQTFISEMKQSKIILAIKGNSYPTNRFFESQAAGSLTFSTKIDDEVEIYGIGEKNKDYIEIDITGKDLIDKITYYFSNLEESNLIAENGRKTWEKYNMLDENGVFTNDTIMYHISGIYKITGFDLRVLK